ncbi:MAG: bifunctional aspartate kinase/homoserine dehydrogenase I [Tannerella sp.]|jgi:aspartokinase/homoserine dehydrogenase 1|nr:bifunctional aspartate kinase/homoserine dehydrogenase I [Tannerella sp.]
MKVLKFGGTSVGSVESITNVKKIVENVKEPVIVVVSALGGITDKLLNTSKLASKGDIAYKKEFEETVKRHFSIIKHVVARSKQTAVLKRIGEIFEELENIFVGVSLIKDLSPKTSDTIVSYGERLSSYMISNIINNAKLYDSRQFIKTYKQFNKHVVDFELTNKLIKNTFKEIPDIAVVPGFISSCRYDDEVTNLGRGGSDYTASILAAALDASTLEIWTDVDGFMTADPKVINSAYVIEKLSFTEAMELSNFGAKVIYPPTIYPAFHKNIPIRVLNTFNPSAAGTLISKETENSNSENSKKAIIKGISSINDTCLVTIQGLGMVGVIGVNYRIFRVLAKNGISVFMVSQASSENNTTFAVKNEDSDLAVAVLNEEFASERERGEIDDVEAEKGLATVAIVGENMKRTPGIAGKLFGTLGRAGISVIACAQGASETNISFVIKLEYLRKALNSIHDSFFLSEYKVLNIFVAGVGTVGGHLLEQIERQQKKLMNQKGVKLNVAGVANSKKVLLKREGLDLKYCIRDLKNNGMDSSPSILRDEIVKMNIFNAIFVDCTSSEKIAALYETFLNKNISIVAANKIAASSSYKNYSLLKETARKRGIKYLFETNVGAGLPIINTMNDLINSGDSILKLEAVLSGSLNFILNTISEKIPFSKAVKMALDAGYAEPDPRIDLSGKDVLRKLVILAREAGYIIEQKDVKLTPFISEKYLKGTIEDFWKSLHELDAEFEEKRNTLFVKNKRLRYVASMNEGKCQVGLMDVDSRHPFYELEGSNNIIMISTERYHDYPMIIKGYGAGADVTAAGIFADIISIANIR